uniref:Putative ovule protein n=1 Tax=Solanum chacoense TaxID=4108 RepID=A0A0V0GLU7_SOLCH
MVMQCLVCLLLPALDKPTELILWIMILKFLGSFLNQWVIVKDLFCIILLLDMWGTMEFMFQCLWMILRSSLGSTQVPTLLVSVLGFHTRKQW